MSGCLAFRPEVNEWVSRISPTHVLAWPAAKVGVPILFTGVPMLFCPTGDFFCPEGGNAYQLRATP